MAINSVTAKPPFVFLGKKRDKRMKNMAQTKKNEKLNKDRMTEEINTDTIKGRRSICADIGFIIII